MTLEQLNNLSPESAKVELTRCCGSSAWVEKMLASRPFSSEDSLFSVASTIWYASSREDWLEAFSHHPKIGDIKGLEKKFAATSSWASEEQGSVAGAEKETLEKLAELNQKYEERFGYIFIICATGKTAYEMVNVVARRLRNNAYDEIRIATSEQNQITKLRLKKLLS